MPPKSLACANCTQTDPEPDPRFAGILQRSNPGVREVEEDGDGTDPAIELDSRAWNDLQARIRSFRRAIQRGERPAIESYAPEGISDRKILLRELVHEEIEFRIKAGEQLSLVSYLDRFPDLHADPMVLRELIRAESDWRRRTAHEARITLQAIEEASGAPTAPLRVGRYELENVIGRGAFGIVYRAWDTVLNRPVALKRPRDADRETPEAIERFVREARSTAALTHPHIVRVYDAGQFDGQSYLVSALVEGQNLANILTAGRPSVRQSAEWVASLADALDHAHRSGVIHRDLKPSNILVDKENRAYLTDFGLAKSNIGQGTLTKKGQIVGTPAYMAPEQATGTERVDERTDVYCLGVILYELLTGSRPFYGSEPMLLARIQDEDPRRPRQLDKGIPRDLETVCLKAMAKQPCHRYANAASFEADLRRYLRGEPVRARRVAPLVALGWRCRRKPVLTGLAAALLLSMTSGFVGIAWQWRRAERQHVQALNALESANALIHSLVLLNTTGGANSDEHGRQARAILDSVLAPIADQARAYPELRNSLISVAMASVQLVDHGLPKEDSLSSLEKTRRVLEKLVHNDSTDLVILDYIGRCLHAEGRTLAELGRIAEADARLRRSLAVWREYSAMTAGRSQASRSQEHESARAAWVGTFLDFSALAARLDRRPQAIASLLEAVSVAEELVQGLPGSVVDRHRLITVCSRLALIEADEYPSQAVSHWRRASELLGQICAAPPASISDRDSLADCYWQMAKLEERIDRRTDAIGHLSRAATVLEELSRADTPSLLKYQERLGECFYWLATLEDRLDHTFDALIHFDRAAALFEGVLRVQPQDNNLRCSLSTCYHVIGRLRADTGQTDQSLEPFRKAIALRESMSLDDPGSARWHSDCAGSWHRLGEALQNLGQSDAAFEAFEKYRSHDRDIREQKSPEPENRS